MHMNNEQVKRKMIYSARDLGDVWSKQGWGMLNLEEMCTSQEIISVPGATTSGFRYSISLLPLPE